jgi:hypothetical protein
MKSESHREVAYAARITIAPTGRRRSELEVRAAVAEALAAAREKIAKAPGYKKVDAVIESEGGFLGLGAEWIWLFVTLAPYANEGVKAFVSGAAKKIGERAGEKLLELLLKELRDRNLGPSAPSPAPDIASVAVPTLKRPHRRKKRPHNNRRRKSEKK